MSRSLAIRALIHDEAHAMLPREVIAALPQYPAKGIRESLGEMFKQGIIDRTGNRSDGFRYYVIRTVKLKAYATQEDRIAGKKLTDAAANRRKKRPIAEFRAEQARKRAEKAERKTAEAARRQALVAKRAEEKAATIAAVEAKREAARLRKIKDAAERQAKRTQSREVRLIVSAPARSAIAQRAKRADVADIPPALVKLQRVESVEEWMARTGQQPQVLESAWNRRAA